MKNKIKAFNYVTRSLGTRRRRRRNVDDNLVGEREEDENSSLEDSQRLEASVAILQRLGQEVEGRPAKIKLHLDPLFLGLFKKWYYFFGRILFYAKSVKYICVGCENWHWFFKNGRTLAEGVVQKWTFLTPDVLGCYASLAGKQSRIGKFYHLKGQAARMCQI